jgi:hypothetical protein
MMLHHLIMVTWMMHMHAFSKRIGSSVNSAPAGFAGAMTSQFSFYPVDIFVFAKSASLVLMPVLFAVPSKMLVSKYTCPDTAPPLFTSGSSSSSKERPPVFKFVFSSANQAAAVYVSYEVVVKGSIDLNSRQQSRHTQNTLEKKKNAPNEDTKHTVGRGESFHRAQACCSVGAHS